MKGDYDMTDTVTFYFVTYREPGFSEPCIKAWTDDKVLLDFYLKFHGMKDFKVKVITDTYLAVSKIINNTCRNDEICLANMLTVQRAEIDGVSKKGKFNDRMMMVVVPATTQEVNHINDNAGDFCSSMVDYGKINELLPWLKKRYLSALERLNLVDIVSVVVGGKPPTKRTMYIELDELMLMLKFFPAEFR